MFYYFHKENVTVHCISKGMWEAAHSTGTEETLFVGKGVSAS